MGDRAPLWHRLAKQFDRQVNAHGRRGVDAADPSPGERVLDIGCGTGTTSFQIANRLGPRGSVVGADISSTMVEAANTRAANTSFTVADAQVHRFADPFDLVYSRFGVMFFEDPAAAFSNIHSALKPTGRMAFVCWQSPMKNQWISSPPQVVVPLLENPISPDPNASGPFSMADDAALRGLLTSAGFSDVSVDGFEVAVNLGDDVDEATAFVCLIIPGAGGLEESDPSRAERVRAAVREVLAPHAGPNGVEMDSAVWIVTARA